MGRHTTHPLSGHELFGEGRGQSLIAGKVIFQSPCYEQGHIPLDQVVQCLINMALNIARTSLCNLFQCLTTLTVKTFFGFVEHHNLPLAPSLGFVQTPLDGIPSFRHVNAPHSLVSTKNLLKMHLIPCQCH